MIATLRPPLSQRSAIALTANAAIAKLINCETHRSFTSKSGF